MKPATLSKLAPWERGRGPMSWAWPYDCTTRSWVSMWAPKGSKTEQWREVPSAPLASTKVPAGFFCVAWCFSCQEQETLLSVAVLSTMIQTVNVQLECESTSWFILPAMYPFTVIKQLFCKTWTSLKTPWFSWVWEYRCGPVQTAMPGSQWQNIKIAYAVSMAFSYLYSEYHHFGRHRKLFLFAFYFACRKFTVQMTSLCFIRLIGWQIAWATKKRPQTTENCNGRKN